MTQTNRSTVRLLASLLAGLLVAGTLSGCGGRQRRSQTDQPGQARHERVRMEVTGYSTDPESTGWRRGWILLLACLRDRRAEQGQAQSGRADVKR